MDGWISTSAVATPDMMSGGGPTRKDPGTSWIDAQPEIRHRYFDIARTIKELKAGRIEYRVDKTAIIHAPIGKVSFSLEALEENFNAFADALIKAKPAAAKGQYMRSISVCSTMGPGIRMNPIVVMQKGK